MLRQLPWAFVLFLETELSILGIRVVCRNDGLVCRRWGVEEEIFSIKSIWLFGLWFTSRGVGSGYFSYIFAIAFLYVFGGSDSIEFKNESFGRAILILSAALFSGLLWRMYRVDAVRLKARKLDGLPTYFRDRVGVSELVATYDSLAYAPDMFWEEFVGLPDFELSKDASRRFRELASHYRALKSLSYIKWAIFIAVIGALIALVTFMLQVDQNGFLRL